MIEPAHNAIPRPQDRGQLKRLLDLFVRHRFGLLHRTGQPHTGFDVIVRDAHAGDEGNLWAFALMPGDEPDAGSAWLESMVTSASLLRRRPDYLIAISATRASDDLHGHARTLADKTRRTVELWDWPVFADRLLEELGSGPWLDADTRTHERQRYCDQVIADYESAPATMPLFDGADKRLASVWVPRRIRVQADIEPPGPHEYLTSLLDALAGALAPRAHLVAVIGQPGAGKTASLMHAAAHMARAARDDQEMPLPVRLQAVDLVDGTSLTSLLGGTDRDTSALWYDPMSSWLLLIDGCDQIADDQSLRLRKSLARIGNNPRVRIVVMTMRSDTWWRQLPARTIRAMLVPGSRRPPGQRLAQMDTLVRKAFAGWSQQKLTTLEREAWEGLRRGRVALSRSAAAPDALASQTDEKRRLVGRLLMETLASHHLARQPENELIAAASLARTHEAARLAVLRRVRDDPEQLERLVHMLLRPRVTQVPVSQLRRLVLVTRVVADLGEHAAPVAKLLSRQIVDVACHPASPWMRSVAGDLLVELAQAGGPVWDKAWKLILRRLKREGDRAAWFETQVHNSKRYEDTPAYWSGVLHDESVHVRIVALRRLARWRNRPEVMKGLLACVQDEGGMSDMEWPAFTAGLVLRGCERTPAFRETLGVLRDILDSGEYIAAGAASLALHPTEAPAAALLEALYDAWELMGTVQEALADIVRPLLQNPNGRRWAEKHWPKAISTPLDDLIASVMTRPQRPAANTRGAQPLSWQVSYHLGRVAARGLAASDATGTSWRALPDPVRRDPRALSALCEAYGDRPERLRELIVSLRDDKPGIFWPSRAQAALGQAALHSRELAEALFAYWRKDEPATYFPGLALEPLVERGDDDAASLYAQWIPETSFVEIIASTYRPLSPRALAHPKAHSAALRRVRRSWKWAIDGRTDKDGRFSRLYIRTLSGVLRALAPAWHGEREICEGLVERAAGTRASTDTREDWLDVALFAWSGSDIPDDLSEMLARRFDASSTDIEVRLNAAQQAGIVGRIERYLNEILNGGNEYAYIAASMLAEHRPMRAYRISKRAAKVWARHPWKQLPYLDGDRWERLVGYAPRVWCDRVLDGLEEWWDLTALSALQLIRILLGFELESEQRAMLVESVIDLTRETLPWKGQFHPMRNQRIGDAAQQLIYEWELDQGTEGQSR